MTRRPPHWLLAFFCLLNLVMAQPASMQTPTPPTPRGALIQEIQARAERDVELDKPAKDITELEILFGDEAADVGLSMAQVLEIYEEAYTAATPVKSEWEKLWDKLRPNAGWLAALIMGILAIFGNALKDSFTKAVKWLLERAYVRLAGFRPFWVIALRKYRRALVGRYEQLKIPFRPGRPLDMHEVYVPLKVQGAHDTDLIDAYRAVAEHPWLMIVGAPGSGKTMLLKRLALKYAEGELADFPTQPFPVLLELNRLSDSEEPLETQLAQVLEANDFPGGERFIEASLEHGLLLLLLDGLDEVTGEARRRVVRQIKDLLQAHPQVRAVITCRTAVYDEEFADVVHQQLEIAEFSDQQIQRFLASWQPHMPPGKSSEHLLRNLRERPRIMGLARNPLLLTIIVYLYTDTPFVLPHSWTAFYDKALAVLLEQSDQVKGVPNRFTADEKRLVLQHLALFNQDSGVEPRRDRRSLDLPTILAEIAWVLPSVSRKPDEARPLLDEIVERSGLLLALDGGVHYQFAHLTLQEFFAAQKLQDDVNGLLARFKADPDAWREVVKLWCGLPHNSSVLIRSLYATHPVMAFECLGDAQQVDEPLADEILTAFQARLGADGAEGEAVTRAFATVAINPQRGAQIFDSLAATARDDKAAPGRRLAAAQALALSNLPQAAALLAECTADYPEARPLLAQMGDLATPVLATWAEQGQEWAFDGLQTVGTPKAAQALADFLWVEDTPLSYWAAWRLATLLTNPAVEDALRAYPLTEAQREAESMEWVWEPFERDPNSALRVIIGRVAYLLNNEDSVRLKDVQRLPSKLLLGLCTVAAARTDKTDLLDRKTHEGLKKQWGELIEPWAPDLADPDKQRALVETTCERMVWDEKWKAFFHGLPHNIQFEWLRRLVRGACLPDINDWRNLNHPSEYDFAHSWHAGSLTILIALLFILSLAHFAETIVNTPQLLSWENGLNGLTTLSLIWGILWLAPKMEWTLSELERWSAISFLLGVVPAIGGVVSNLSNNWLFGVVSSMLSGAMSGALGGIIFGAENKHTRVSAAIGTIGGTVFGAVSSIMIALVSNVVGDVVNSTVFSMVFGAILGAMFGALVGAVVGAVAGALGGMITYWPSLYLYNVLGLEGLILFWPMWLFLTLMLYRQAKRHQQAAENPLQGLLYSVESQPAISGRQRWLDSLIQMFMSPLCRSSRSHPDDKEQI